MSEPESTPVTESAPEPVTPVEPPSDFREYNKWRNTDVLPPKEEAPVAVEETPQAKTEPQSGADESQQPEDEGETEEAKAPRANGRVRKIDRLTRENEQLRAQLAQVQPKPTAPEPPPPPVEPAGKPHLRDYPTLEAYQEALTDWKIDQREAQRKAEAAQAEAQAQARKIQTAWDTAQDTARNAYSDYDDVIQSVRVPEGPGVPAMRQALLEDDHGGEALYYLATHPDDLKRIAQLSPVSAVKEIGRLTVQFTKSSAAGNPKPAISNAPRPPAPLSRPAGPTVRDSIHDEQVARDYKRWTAARLAQLKG